MGPARLHNDPGFCMLAGEFVAALPDRINRLRECIEGGDRATARTLAHQLKGAGGGYGFDSITRSAAVLEHALATDAPEGRIDALLGAFAAECEEVARIWNAMPTV